MFRRIAAIAAATMAMSAFGQDESFRLFFDTKGAAEHATRPAGPLSFTNPTVVNSDRLYLYVEYGTANQQFVGMNLVVNVTGPAVITGGNFYNPNLIMPQPSGSLPRWANTPNKIYGDFIFDQLDTPQRWWINSNVAGLWVAYGAGNTIDPFSPEWGHPSAGDPHFSGYVGGDGSTYGTTLLGYVDVASTGPGVAEVRLQNGTSGNAGRTVANTDLVYFGFGDAALVNKRGALSGGPGGPSAIADAYIVPEPTSLVAIGIVMAVASCRRYVRRIA